MTIVVVIIIVDSEVVGLLLIQSDNSGNKADLPIIGHMGMTTPMTLP
jgi:hypothetical protein